LFLTKGSVSYLKGKLDIALGYHRKSLALLEQIDPHSYFIPINLFALALDYHRKGELKLAIESHEKALSIIPEGDHYGLMAWKTMISQNMGKIFYQKGDLDTALDYNMRSFDYMQRTSRTFKWMPRLFVNIIEVFLAKRDIEHAHIYLKKLEQLNEKIESRESRSLYQLARALILKNSVRLNDHAEAVNVLKNIVNRASTHVDALKCLCELYFEEFQMTNQMEVLDDIQPLIDQLQKNAINENSYSLLADVKLLQAKMALIQINMVGARKLLTEAQNIADTHDLQLLAGEISREHDRLLEELELWNSFKKTQASISERLKIASIDGVMERLQGRSAIKVPEVSIEEPILLLIMDKSGVSYFTHSFIGEWDFDDLFSSFISAFNTFSDELFSKSIDRIKIGENTILINPIEPFLACYIIKGQSYPAQQKLTRFSTNIKANSEIWDALKKALTTGEMLELNDPPSLGNCVNEIFT
jgi:tetratricopeptide (TPR) repeat protein